MVAGLKEGHPALVLGAHPKGAFLNRACRPQALTVVRCAEDSMKWLGIVKTPAAGEEPGSLIKVCPAIQGEILSLNWEGIIKKSNGRVVIDLPLDASTIKRTLMFWRFVGAA